jgi:glycosyltransferase involved in cell wall biosynthesis
MALTRNLGKDVSCSQTGRFFRESAVDTGVGEVCVSLMSGAAKVIPVRASKVPTTYPRSRPSKIVHLTSVHPVFDVRIFHKECRSLARAGYDVILIAVHGRDETFDGVRVKAIPRPTGRLSRMLFTTMQVLRQAIREDADLYHFHDPELIPVGLILRLRGKTVLYDAHEDVSAGVAFKHYIPRLVRRPLAWFVDLIENVSSRCFSARVAATEPISRRFAFRHGRTVVINNYPLSQNDRLVVSKQWAERGLSVAYVGVLSEDRCVNEMVQAMSFLPETMQITLNLAGEFSPPSLAARIASLKGWDRSRFLGTISRTQVAELLSDTRAGLVVFRPEPNNFECAPNKLFEYMQAGIPVIASDFPGFRRVVAEAQCGLLVDPLKPREIAEAIEYLVTHPEEAEQMGGRGREAVSNRFHWAGEERKLLELYQTLLAPRAYMEAPESARGAAVGERK